MKIAFHSRLLTERGSEGAMLDYARLNVSVLGNESLICLPDDPGFTGNPLLERWRREFQVILYRHRHELGRILQKQGVEAVYLTKPGPCDGFLVPGIRNCVHAQFLCDEFHGDAYAYLSRWMSKVMTGAEDSFVPFYVPRLKTDHHLRAKLGIPREAKVFGRHGGWDTFNIPFNVHYLPATVDSSEKAAFLATCDAMLHARWHGETFGLAVGEFAVLGKPVITFWGSRERAHLEMLGAEAVVYKNERELGEILEQFLPRGSGAGEYGLYRDPAHVMKLFAQRFLAG